MPCPLSSALCDVCKHIDFAAILTPREVDLENGQIKAPFRSEWQGNGKSLVQTTLKEQIRSVPKIHRHGIRTARYEDLSESSDDKDVEAALRTSNQIWSTREQAPTSPGPGIESSAAGSSGGTLSRSNDHQYRNAQHFQDDESNFDEESGADDDDDSDASASSYLSHYTNRTRIDLTKQAKGSRSYFHGLLYNLGSIWDVRSRRHQCRLCWLLWKQTRLEYYVKRQHLTKSRCVLKLVELKGHRADISRTKVAMLNLVYAYAYKIGNSRDEEWTSEMFFYFQGTHRDLCDMQAQVADGEIVPFDDRNWGEARPVRPHSDYKLYKEWLRLCETVHDHESPARGGDMNFRLIDVLRMCLIEYKGPVSNAPRFIALSYVWGKLQQQLMLTSDRLGEFFQPGFFVSHIQTLDRTVLDAFNVVLKMGERYLWVDALCIEQDSKQDKEKQLPQMQHIYGSAVLTIVAGYGTNANSGLVGVSLRRRTLPFYLELDDIRVTIRGGNLRFEPFERSVESVEDYLQGNEYSKRAWTFQEAHLSRRVLVFALEGAYWECARCTWCEETHWESSNVDFLHWRAIKDPTPLDLWKDGMRRKHYDLDGEWAQEELIRNSFASLVRQYTTRKLGYDQDVLNACTGVLDSIKEREQTDFLYGLRTRHFGNDLLFNIPNQTSPRFPGLSPEESGFPSWSWASWKGPIEIANESRGTSWDPVKKLIPCDGVRCVVLQADPSEQDSLRVINPLGGWQFRSEYVRQGEGIADSTLDYGKVESSSIDRSKSPVSIPEYSQDITLAELQLHPAFSRIKRGFHIMFRTFASFVLIFERYKNPVANATEITDFMGGTHKASGQNPYAQWHPRYKLAYGLTRKTQANLSLEPDVNHEVSAKQPNLRSEETSSDGDLPLTALPEGFDRNSSLRFVAQRTKRISEEIDCGEYSYHGYSYQYDCEIPDGLYLLLYMNNNQLPMWGHLLCKPVLQSRTDPRTWHNEILQRVCGVDGPTQILEKTQQDKYRSYWGTFILS